jgi:hypothetical protein
MASTYVHVIMTGIISLIPDANTPPKSWNVRLQDAQMDPKFPHVPSIVVEHGNVSSATAPDRSNMDGTLDAWLLEDGEINVKSTILSAAITSSRPLPYVLSIEDGCGGVANCPIAKTYNGVSMLVTQGSLEATELEDSMWQWDVLKAPPVWIAEEVCWRFEIDGPELELWLPYKTGQLKLKIVAPTGGTPTRGGDIELRLQNTMDMDIFPMFGPVPKPIDEHAAIYYDQASANPRQAPVLTGYNPTGTAPMLPQHMHRLTDVKIGSKPAMAMQLAPLLSLRVNCPPAQWNG